MLKRRIIKKLFISTSALFAIFLICLIPTNNYDIKTNKEVIYISDTIKTNNIYLLNKNNMLGRTSVVVNYDDAINKAYELIDILISGGKGESLIPSGFKSIIPSDVNIISVTLEDDILLVNFSKELLNTSYDNEVPMIEAIIYTLTEIDGIKGISIYVEGELLKVLPQTKTPIKEILDRNFGINKKYELTSLSNINQVTTYYIDKNEDNYYYVPVTKYVNDEREKIKIIIEDLTSSKSYNTNLMSFLNSNAKLLKVQNENNIMELTFNNYILDNFDKKDILEEVIYTICLSIRDNYDVEEVIFNVDDEEIYKSVLKSIE